MEIAALIVAVVSALGTVGAVVVALVARSDSKASQTASVEAERRATGAAEKMAAIQAAMFDQPPWRVDWFGGDTFLLTNNSPLDAHEVRVDGYPEDVGLNIGHDLPWEIGAMSADKFMFKPSLGHGMQRDVVVSWKRDGSDQTLEWRHPIPTRGDK